MMFPEAIEIVLESEGGYSNDPLDKGGETKYGITKRRYPDIDIKSLTISQAKELYREDFWDKYRIEDYSEELRFIILDMYINHNPEAVGLILQRAVNNHIGYKFLKVDGKVGPMTRAALDRFKINPLRVLAYRSKYYSDIVRNNPSQKRLFYGWMFHRVFKVITRFNLI